MAIVIDGSSAAGTVNLGTNGTISNLAVGGLPDGIVDTDMLATNAVTQVKVADDAVGGNELINNSVIDAKVVGTTAKVWANLDGTGTPSLRDSYNVASVTDNGSGDYTFTYTTALANDDYCIITLAGQSTSADDLGFSGIQSQATDNCRFVSRTSRTSGKTDFPLACVAVFGDSA